jgi:hypothetical protein
MALSVVMVGLVPAIHAFLIFTKQQDVEARDIGERSDAVFDGYARA